MGLSMMNVDRLLSMEMTVAPGARVGLVPVATLYLRLGLRDSRLQSKLGDGRDGRMERDVRSLHWESHTFLMERALLTLWMQATIKATTRTIFGNEVISVIAGAKDEQQLRRHLYRWFQCITRGRPAPLDRCPTNPKYEVVDDGTLPSDYLKDLPKSEPKDRPVPLNVVHGILESRVEGVVRTDPQMHAAYVSEMLHTVIARRVNVTPEERKTLLRYYQNTLGYKYPDPDRGHAELCLYWTLDIIRTWQNSLLEPDEPKKMADEPVFVAPAQPEAGALSRIWKFVVARMPVWWKGSGNAPQEQSTNELPEPEPDMAEPTLANRTVPIVDLLVQYLTDNLSTPKKASAPTVAETRRVMQALVHSAFTTAVTLHHQTTHLLPLEQWLDKNDVTNATNLFLIEERQCREMYAELERTPVAKEGLIRALELLERGCTIGLYACIDKTPRKFQHFVNISTQVQVKEQCYDTDGFTRQQLHRFLRICQWAIANVRLYLQLPNDDAQSVVRGTSTLDIVSLINLRGTNLPGAGCHEGQDLANRIYKCKHDTEILRQVRSWLRKKGYGERQYAADSLQKRRKRLVSVENLEHWD